MNKKAIALVAASFGLLLASSGSASATVGDLPPPTPSGCIHFDKYIFSAVGRTASELALVPGEPYSTILGTTTPGAISDVKETILANFGVTDRAKVAQLRLGLNVIDVEFSIACGFSTG